MTTNKYKKAGVVKQNKPELQEEVTISKEEILAGIREGLLELKERRLTGRKPITIEELLNEL